MSKTPADKTIEEQTFEALEDALKIDLGEDGLGVLDDVSLDELEDKVSNAARELKSAGATPRASAASPVHARSMATQRHRTMSASTSPAPAPP